MEREDIKVAGFREIGLLHINAAQFQCEVTELAVAGGSVARIAIKGSPDGLRRLYEYVEESLKK